MTNLKEFNRKATKYLNDWKTKPDRKPLIIRGARQVGKTFLIDSFGKDNYENYIYLNLEKPEEKRLFQEDLSLNEFKLILKTRFGYDLIPSKTLIFIDEIQNSTALFNLLRFFYEDLNDIHVIAAGSLLENCLNDGLISIPVGRVEFLFISPLDFYEYLSAIGQDDILNFIKEIKPSDEINNIIHESIIKHYYDYVLVGGMPAAIRGYINMNFIDLDRSFYSNIMLTYLEDSKKYVNEFERKYVESVLNNVNGAAGRVYNYENFGNSGFKSREISNAFTKLENAMLLNQVPATTSTELPIQSKNLKQKKLIFLDTGLINYSNGLTLHNKISEYQASYKGRIFEQIVGQELISLFETEKPKLFYWTKDKSEGKAEIDYCLQHKDKIVGIEIKSGSGSTLRSLLSFSESVASSCLVRVHNGLPKLEKVQFNEKEYSLLSIPFYLVLRLKEFLD